MERIFVFGSNRRGIHGAGSAKQAALAYGAVPGVGEGARGRSYAIPTKHAPHRTMTLEEIRPGVERFVAYACQHPELLFDVVAIGCGRAGYTPPQIAPMFAGAPDNVRLPPGWREIICRYHGVG